MNKEKDKHTYDSGCSLQHFLDRRILSLSKGLNSAVAFLVHTNKRFKMDWNLPFVSNVVCLNGFGSEAFK